jgi:uncharacterized membrane protein/predicted DsbA family dithiol-disulfide isomerase
MAERSGSRPASPTQLTPATRRLLLGFSLLGLAASSTSAVVHYRLLTQPGFGSFCDISAAMSCSDAYLSRFGTIWGVPVALAGVFFFTAMLVIVAIGGRDSSPARENVPAYVFALSVAGLGFSLYLAWASLFVLKTLCLLCASTYLSVIALVIVSGRAAASMATLPRSAARDLRALAASPVALLLAILLTGGGVAVASMFPHETSAAALETQYPSEFAPLTSEEKPKFIAWWDVQEKVDVPFSNAGAKVLIVKFNDYQCPSCRIAFEAYKGILAKYLKSGDVKFILKQYPLDPKCNPGGGPHPGSCEAAVADVLARRSGTGDKLEQWFFDHQDSLNPGIVRKAAREIGGIRDFDTEYQAALQEVKADTELGAKLGVTSTPTFFINGHRIKAVLQPRAFDAAINLELERAKSHTN